MGRDAMLKLLSERGDSSDYDDGMNGWFGWTVDGDRLTVQFEKYVGADQPSELVKYRWRLAPMAGE